MIGLLITSILVYTVVSRRRGKKKSTRPIMTKKEIVEVLQRYYGIEDPKIKDLDSYDGAFCSHLTSNKQINTHNNNNNVDLNFRIESENKFYVLKVFSSRRGDASMVIMENQAMKHVESKSCVYVSVPRVISPKEQNNNRMKNGVITYLSKTEPETPYYIRLLTYLPGKLFGHLSEPASSDLLVRLGRALGDMDRALNDFDCASAQRTWEWDLTQCVEEGRKYSHYIRNEQDREIAQNALNDYERVVMPLHQEKLRWRVIHSDANDYNICVPSSSSSSSRVGIFDFGDMVYSPLVHNVSIAIAYASLKQKDFMKAAECVLQGYTSVMRLSNCEIGVLLPCIKARLAHSVCKSAYSRFLEPENEYISVTENDAWRLLRVLSLRSNDDDSVFKRFLHVLNCNA